MHYKVIDGTDGIPPEAFVLVAAKLRDFKQRPLTDEDMAKMKEVGGQQTDTRKALNHAARILNSEIEKGKWRSHPGLRNTCAVGRRRLWY